MLSSAMKGYHLELMLSSGTTCYHLGWNVIIWDAMLSSGANGIIWDKMLSSGAKFIMVSSGANVIIWCYHVMLSCDVIIWDDNTPLFYFSWKLHSLPLHGEKADTKGFLNRQRRIPKLSVWLCLCISCWKLYGGGRWILFMLHFLFPFPSVDLK